MAISVQHNRGKSARPYADKCLLSFGRMVIFAQIYAYGNVCTALCRQDCLDCFASKRLLSFMLKLTFTQLCADRDICAALCGQNALCYLWRQIFDLLYTDKNLHGFMHVATSAHYSTDRIVCTLYADKCSFCSILVRIGTCLVGFKI